MILQKTLPNGLELIVKRTTAPVAAIQVWVDVGSIDETSPEAGWCHFLEHMLFKGTKKRSTAEIAGEVEGTGGEMNAFTSFEYTVYHITGSNTRWKLYNEVLADMVLGSQFYPNEFAPEKEVILEEIKRGEDSPDRKLYQQMYGLVYGGAGYGRPVIGFPRTVKACTAGKLKSFWKKWYAPSLMTVVVTGDVDAAEVEKEIMKTWGKAPKGRALRERRRDVGFQQKIHGLAHQKAIHYPVNSIRWAGAIPAMKMSDPRLPALDVAIMALGHGEASRLHKKLFRDLQVVTGISCSLWAPAVQGLISFDVDAPVEKGASFKKPLWDEITKFCEEGPSEEELARVKAILESDRIYAAQSTEDVAHRLGYQSATMGNIRFDLEYLAAVRELTPSDVKQAARDYLLGATMRESAVLPENADIKAFWKESETALQTNAAKAKPAKRDTSSKVIRHVLPNGIELHMFPREDLPVVSFQMAALGGIRTETRQNAGVGNILSDVWEKGPSDTDAEKFALFLESKASRIDTFYGRNSQGISGTTLTQNLSEIFPAAVRTFFDPALAEREFSQARDVALEDIKTLEDTPTRLISKMFAETLFEDHPYGLPGVGFENSVKALTPKSVREHYNQCLSGKKIIATVAGKFDPDMIVRPLEAIKRAAAAANGGELPFHAPLAPRVAEVKKGREQSHVIVGFEGTRVQDDRRFALKILLNVMSGQSGRLFINIRDKQGLCYTVAPLAMEGIEPGYVGVYIGTDPTKREHAIEAIHTELKKLADKPVTSAEMKRAKEFILGKHHMEMQMNSSIATIAGFNALYGLPSDDQYRWEEHLKKVSASDVCALAAELFEQPPVTAIIV